MKQGRASRDVKEGWHREPRSMAINQNFPSQLGSAIDPMAVERYMEGKGYEADVPKGPSRGMGVGPGANREVMKSGGQGRY